MGKIIISLDHVSKNYYRRGFFNRTCTTVLDELCFDVPTGQSVAVLGPNGAGKTTLLKAILGLISFAGQITICGQNPAHPQVREKIAFVPELPVAYPFLRKNEFLNFFGGLENSPPFSADYIENIAEDKNMSEYSKGMVQRLNFARAMAKNPEILFLDEPIIGLDPIGQLNVTSMIKDFHASGKTVYINTHSIDFAFTVADRVIILHQGDMYADIGVQDWSKEQVSELFMGLDSEVS